MPLGDYPLIFDRLEKMSVSFSTSVFENEDGSERRLNLTPLPVRVFEGTHLGLTNNERDTLQTFFQSKKGALTSFSLEDPVTSTTFTVRFLEKRLNFIRRDDSRWDIRIKLKEIL